MASITMTSSFLGGSAATISKQLPAITANHRRGSLAMIKASKKNEMKSNIEESTRGRRDLVFGGAAALAIAISLSNKIAMADVIEPTRGTPEAKKKYAPVCVTMPTARICRK